MQFPVPTRKNDPASALQGIVLGSSTKRLPGEPLRRLVEQSQQNTTQ